MGPRTVADIIELSVAGGFRRSKIYGTALQPSRKLFRLPNIRKPNWTVA